MTEESNGHTRPDFDEHLREVVRRRQSQQAAGDELAEDRLDLSRERNVFSPRGRIPGDAGNGNRLTWVALGLGGAALALTLILGALVYRQGGHLGRLEESLTLLEEQMEVNNPQQIGSGLQADIAQLNARLNALDHRLLKLEQDRNAGRPDGTDTELQARFDRLDETIRQLQAKLTSLEAKQATVAKAGPAAVKPTAKPGTGNWYIVLASLADATAAEKLQRRFRRQGIRAEIQQVEVKGVRRYRLRVGPFDTSGRAKREAERIKRKLKLTSVWLSR